MTRGTLARGSLAGIARARGTGLVPALAGGGLVLLFYGQRLLEPPRVSATSAGALIAGLGLWALAVVLSSPARRTPDLSASERSPVRRVPLVLALVGALVAWLASGDGEYTTLNVTAWLVAIGAWCVAWWPRVGSGRHLHRGSVRDHLKREAWWLLGLGVIVAVGAFFRFYQLDEIPSDPTGDHIEKLLDMQTLVTGERPIFFDRNGGREPGQFYFTYGVLMEVVGFRLSFETLKFGTALIGVLAIPAVALFAREVAGAAAGLFAALLFAISAWPAGTARVGVRFPFGPLATALALWLLFRYIRRGDRRDALACGVVMGLGLHGYTSFRVVLVLVPVLLGLTYLYRRRHERQTSPAPVAGSALILSTAFMACLPLARYAIDHPDRVSARMRATFLEDPQLAGSALVWSEAFPTFLETTWNALLAFNWRGDREGLMNAVLDKPFLDGVTAAALLAGLVILLYDAFGRRRFLPAALLVSIPILLLPSTLQLALPNQNPSVSRLGSLAPIIFLIAALPFAFLWASVRRAGIEPWWSTLRSRGRAFAAASALVVTALAIAAHQNYVTYFDDYAFQYRQFVPTTHEIAEAIEARLGEGRELDDVYVLGYPHWVDARLVGFALGDPLWAQGHNSGPGEPLPPADIDRPLLFVVNRADARRRELATRFPGGTYSVIRTKVPGKAFLLYAVPPS